MGFDIDLAKELCKRINTQCIFIENPLDALIPFLEAKKIDVITPSLSIAEKHQQGITFIDKPYAADSRPVVKKGSPVMSDLATLEDKCMGALWGTAQETCGNEHWTPKDIEIVSYQGQDNIYSDLIASRADAAFQDEAAASEGSLKQPIGEDYRFGGSSTKDEELFGADTGMGLHEEDSELHEALNKVLAGMRKDGTYDKLAKKYSDFNIYGE